MIWKDYIGEIGLNHVRNIPKCSINLSNEARTHLIVTGPNGSGKTTFVNDLYNSLNLKLGLFWDFVPEGKKKGYSTLEDIYNYCITERNFFYNSESDKIGSKISGLPISTDLGLNPIFYLAKDNEDFFIYFSEAHRKENFQKPAGPHILNSSGQQSQFLQLMVNFKTQQAYLYEDMSRTTDPIKLEKLEAEYKQYKEWFQNLEDALKKLLGHDNVQIEYERENFNFRIIEDGKEPYEFKQLSDGYAAILRVMTDIMLQMSDKPIGKYKKAGIAIIDEIETHLHVELQQKILPFLTEFFPNVQFIVTSHSPFILSSTPGTKIFDISTQSVYDSFTQYSYPNIVENYFNVSLYSDEIKKEMKIVEDILAKQCFSENDITIIKEFDKKVNTYIDKGEPLELKRKWLELKLKNREKLHDIF